MLKIAGKRWNNRWNMLGEYGIIQTEKRMFHQFSWWNMHTCWENLLENPEYPYVSIKGLWKKMLQRLVHSWKASMNRFFFLYLLRSWWFSFYEQPSLRVCSRHPKYGGKLDTELGPVDPSRAPSWQYLPGHSQSSPPSWHHRKGAQWGRPEQSDLIHWIRHVWMQVFQAKTREF